MNVNYNKIGLIVICIMLILMYALYIICANMAEQTFSFVYSDNSNELHFYSSIPTLFFSMYIFYIHLISILMFYLHKDNKIKGWIYLNIIIALIWISCISLKVILGYFLFELCTDVLQLVISQLSVNIIYMMYSLYYVNVKR